MIVLRYKLQPYSVLSTINSFLHSEVYPCKLMMKVHSHGILFCTKVVVEYFFFCQIMLYLINLFCYHNGFPFLPFCELFSS